MPSTSSILSTLKKDFPAITFKRSDTFRWSPEEGTIYYADDTDSASLLHEVAHALLKHTHYKYDVALLEIERQAWDVVVSDLSKRYDIPVTEEEVENMLDTYRDWLHSRSLCPTCQATGIQADKATYNCLACNTNWRVNEARSCALRRYKTK